MVFKLGVAVAVLSISVFAGCVGTTGSSSSAAGGTGPAVSAGPAAFDDTTGGIEGTVMDPELQPIGGAQVGILADETLAAAVSVLTDGQGAFSFSHVPPGTHVVAAQQLGYQSITKSVNIEAGKVTTVNLALDKLASDAPYARTIEETVQFTSVMYKLTPTCLYNIAGQGSSAKTCGGVRFNGQSVAGNTVFTDCAACESHTKFGSTSKKYADFNERWQTIVGEAQWTAQTGLTGHGFLFDIDAPNITRGASGSIDQASPYTWYKGTNKSPISIRIDKSALTERKIPESDWNNYPAKDACTAPTQSKGNNCDWFWRMFAAYCDLGNCEQGFGPDYGIMLEGKAHVYFSFFIGDAAPAGFSAIPDR